MTVRMEGIKGDTKGQCKLLNLGKSVGRNEPRELDFNN